MENSKPIFISYSRIDKNTVFPFVRRIEQELNTICWIDSEGIEGGSQFEEVIVNAIDESKVVLFMLSDSSINSMWTRREVFYAEDEGKKIVPIVIDGKGLRKWFKFHFGNVDYIDIQDEEQCDKLLNNLASWIGVKRMSKKNNSTEKSSDFFKPQIKISADKTIITLSIRNGLNLILKKDAERNCFIGEVPVQEILEMFKGNIGNIKNTAKETILGPIATSIVYMFGPIGAVGERLMKNYTKEDNENYIIFNITVSKLNQQYGLHLIKRNTSHSDFTVEVNADRIYDLL